MFSKFFAAAAAAAALSATAAYADIAPQRTTCEATSFRVYFEPGATTLNDDAQTLIAAAARDVAGCADVNVAMTPANNPGSQANQMRSAAIAAEMREHGIDVEMAMPHMVRFTNAAAAGPAYIEVRMTPEAGLAS